MQRQEQQYEVQIAKKVKSLIAESAHDLACVPGRQWMGTWVKRPYIALDPKLVDEVRGAMQEVKLPTKGRGRNKEVFAEDPFGRLVLTTRQALTPYLDQKVYLTDNDLKGLSGALTEYEDSVS